MMHSLPTATNYGCLQVYPGSTEVSYQTTDPSETLSNSALFYSLSDPNAAFR